MNPVDAMDRWLIALDIDGTVITEDGVLTPRVAHEITRVRDLGHEVMLATGRSVSMTLPVADRLDITPQYLLCANGAITLGRDMRAPTAYEPVHIETFDPTEVLTTIRTNLPTARYAVEDPDGLYRFTDHFPDGSLGAISEMVPFEELLHRPATRVVVIAPEHGMDEFLDVVETMGLHKVSYNVGWTAWLDIAPDGVTKASGLERVREWLGIPRTRVMAIGDGRNDIEMLRWASEQGLGVAMGQASAEVAAVANERTGTDHEDGLAGVLERYFAAS